MISEYNSVVPDGPKKNEKLFAFVVEKLEEGSMHFNQILKKKA